MKKIIVFISGTILCSCCDICGQPVPELRPMPNSGIYVIEDIVEVPVERTGK